MNHEPLRPLTTAEIDTYRNDGVALIKGVLDQDWIDLIADAIEQDIADPAPGFHSYETDDGTGNFHGNFDVRLKHEGFRRYCEDSPLPRLAAELMGTSKVNLLYDQLFVKEPGTNAPTPWHNDQPYWPVLGWNVMSFWLAVDPVTLESGAVEYIRGSHKWDRWFQPRSFASKSAFQYEKNPDYEPMIDVEAGRDGYDIVSFDMDPGDLIAFHAMTVHGSGGNTRRDRRRRGYTVRYTGEDVVYDQRPGINPGINNAELSPGDAQDSRQYPVVWPRQARQAA